MGGFVLLIVIFLAMMDRMVFFMVLRRNTVGAGSANSQVCT